MIDRFKFFEKNKLCPICKNEPSLYLSIADTGSFKYDPPLNDTKCKDKFTFYPLKDYFFNLHPNIVRTDYIKFNMINNIDFSVSLSSESLFRIIEHNSMYLFYLCNPDGFELVNNKSINSYNINPAKGCYYKSTNPLSVKNNDKSYIISLDANHTLNVETFYVKYQNDIFIKNYCLSYDFNQNKSNFYYWKDKLLSDKTFSKVSDKKDSFHKELEILEYYPDFSNNKIIDKFQSWITFS